MYKLLIVDEKSAIALYIRKLYDIEKRLREHDYEACRQIAAALCNDLSALVNKEYHVNPIVEKALSFILENYSMKLSLKTIASNIHVNPSHLSRMFKKETGEVITAYINKTRIDKAKELLAFTDMLTYEIAEAVGFKDSAYFSLVFKKVTGVSPKDFKDGLRGTA